MGYLDNTSITVDAILTKKGRELLAKGDDSFEITQFALGDDEVDYQLWNAAHPKGTSYYGIIIDNMPLLEAFPDETQMMRYKLVTLPKATARLPVVSVPEPSITLIRQGDSTVISPNTNPAGGNSTLGYTAILANSDAADLVPEEPVRAGLAPSVPTFLSDEDAKQSISAVGFAFRVIAKPQVKADITTTITIIGNETGGQTSINVTVKKQEVATVGS